MPLPDPWTDLAEHLSAVFARRVDPDDLRRIAEAWRSPPMPADVVAAIEARCADLTGCARRAPA